MSYENIVTLRISIQNALIGRITKEVRGIYVKINKNSIILSVVVDGKESNYWREMIYEIGTEVISDFNSRYTIEEKLIRLDYPKSLFFKDYICVYKRFERLLED